MLHLIMLFVFVLFSPAFAEPAIDRWNYYNQRDGVNYEPINDVFHRDGEGYFACGATGTGQGIQRWIMRMNENGEVIWSSTYGQGRLNTIIESDAGNILVGGQFNDRFGAMMVDPKGRVIWENNYATTNCQSVI